MTLFIGMSATVLAWTTVVAYLGLVAANVSVQGYHFIHTGRLPMWSIVATIVLVALSLALGKLPYMQ